VTAATLIPRKLSRFSRTGLVVVALGLAFACLGLHRRGAEQRERSLVRAIFEAGGTVRQPSFDKRWDAFIARRPAPETVVDLADSQVDDAWLQEHDDLRALEIDSLVMNQSVSSVGLGKLLKAHEVQSLSAYGIDFDDVAAEALARNPRFKELYIGTSDLSDEDLARLPLEELESLEVARTSITQVGVIELRRCGQLRNLGIDGTLFSPETVAALVDCPALTYLWLDGAVTEQQLLLVPQLTHLRMLLLQDAEIDESARHSLEQSLPNVEIRW